MSELKKIVRDELVAFAWDDYALDDVVDADPEWADDLAELIADTVSRRVLWPVEITDEMTGSVRAVAENMGLEVGTAGAEQILRAALEAAGLTVTRGGAPC
jgi:hypothetical protein